MTRRTTYSPGHPRPAARSLRGGSRLRPWLVAVALLFLIVALIVPLVSVTAPTVGL